MTYTILTSTTVADYLKTLEVMQAFFDDIDHLKVTEITEGNVNLVFRVQQVDSHNSVIVKQAIPYLRSAGEKYPLSRQRMTIEIAALASAKKYSPDTIPTIYHHSTDQSLMVMQDLSNHQMLRDAVFSNTVLNRFAQQISSYLANTLFSTSDWQLNSEEKKAAVKTFINPELCKIIEEIVFISPYQHQPNFDYNPKLTQNTIDKVHNNRAVKIAAAQMKYSYMTNAQALLHGDLHIGSIMVNDEETFVIDPEFAFYGPIGFDIGMLLGNLYMLYFLHPDKAYGAWLLETIEQIWQQFAENFKALAMEKQANAKGSQWQYKNGMADFAVYVDTFLATMLTDTVGFIGCKLIRRVLGLPTLPYFTDIKDLDKRAIIESNIIDMATTVLVEREDYTSMSEIGLLAKSIKGQLR